MAGRLHPILTARSLTVRMPRAAILWRSCLGVIFSLLLWLDMCYQLTNSKRMRKSNLLSCSIG